MEFIDPRTTPFVRPRSRGELPHLYKPGAYYFVTYRLADAVVRTAGRKDAQRSGIPLEQMTPADIVGDYDPPLTLGSCLLRDEAVARVCKEAILKGAGERYELAAWCVMPNHVHAVLAPLAGISLDKILQSWKGGTARTINLALARSGTLWERESFDHLVRSTTSLRAFVEYTEQNPVAAGLCEAAAVWPFSSAGIGFRFENA